MFNIVICTIRNQLKLFNSHFVYGRDWTTDFDDFKAKK